MLNRQKALLQLVDLAGGAIDRLVLTKWAFLVRNESESRGGESFYDFVPYHYGPFSFGLYQEAGKLVSLGYLKEQGKSTWVLGDVRAPAVHDKLRRELTLISTRFRKFSRKQLIEYVYEKYPRFTVNSDLKRLAQRSVAPIAVYTAGYERKSIDAFLHGLTEAGIAHLIDVRRNPIARRYGFHRSTLERLCNSLDIQYTHVPSLGIASELRQGLDGPEAYDSLFRNYEETTLQKERTVIESVAGWVRRSPSVLVCMEAEASCCHRARLAEPISQATGLRIVHL